MAEIPQSQMRCEDDNEGNEQDGIIFACGWKK
jgi:hypothetical protein